MHHRLFDFIEDLLAVDLGVASMAAVIAEIFTGEPELCLKLKEHHVARIFSLIAQPELPGRPELLHALQAMAKVRKLVLLFLVLIGSIIHDIVYPLKVEKLDLPIRRNQAFIVTYFSKTRERFCDHLLGDDKQEGSSSSKLINQGEGNISLGEMERKGSEAARKELLIQVATL